MIEITRRVVVGALAAVVTHHRPGHKGKPTPSPSPTPSPTPTEPRYASYGELSYGEGLYGG